MKKLFKHFVNFLDLVAYEKRINDQIAWAENERNSAVEHLANLSDYEKDETVKRYSRIVADTYFHNRERDRQINDLLSKLK